MANEYIKREDSLALLNKLRLKAFCAADRKLEKAYSEAIREVEKVPAADVVEVVRCKDCAMHYVTLGRDMCTRNAHGSGDHWIGLTATLPDAFCSRGGRKEASSPDG